MLIGAGLHDEGEWLGVAICADNIRGSGTATSESLPGSTRCVLHCRDDLLAVRVDSPGNVVGGEDVRDDGEEADFREVDTRADTSISGSDIGTSTAYRQCRKKLTDVRSRIRRPGYHGRGGHP